MIEYSKKITDNVKFLRKSRNISQRKLADILEFSSQNYIAKIELYKNYYNIDHLYRIADHFDVSIYSILPNNIE